LLNVVSGAGSILRAQRSSGWQITAMSCRSDLHDIRRAEAIGRRDAGAYNEGATARHRPAGL
jgi:hypothetical protein